MAGVVVIFDFDSTIIECDSDNWVLDEFGLTEKFYQLLPSMLWNPLMDKIMNELHAQGKTMEEIVEVLNRTPIHPRIIPAIEAAYSLGCELRIVSDANIFFIETILKHHGVLNCFSKITANPSYVNGEGRLIICPYHDYLKSSHGCNLCPPNMCKGKVMEMFQNSLDDEGKKKIIYLGDGSGDFCPSLKLKESDYLMPRMNFALSDLVSKNSNDIKAHVHGWRDGEELENVLLHIINKANIGKGNIVGPKIISVDCKMGNISIDAHKHFPEALSVPN
ncbi:putative hydrolase [Medicago truncatula]|uniref:2,3-diketo-5-methylthio-1-phosphopentane phosphatase n=1 Tax=Medicago truncatula TaxID=3880 RepID=B7FI56_MEDTR|nr:inorganic pyrophosphatase 2 [Medicago truncatula]ACJ84435.1 unknown [Medicago truncatula]AES67879.2 2,3-diketo-5-methylthio-1-phosphopentane phosphatase [Medicago truncatula]AFK35188.1 unknown [Medicago truncatula]RHN76295.1 putative hydrolase [Medicago truncatula]